MSRAPNRLIHETSPYLAQHAHNPVDWYPWGEEAFEKARREDKPVFLSIGYSACHWCHVMERESFENESLATLLNERFVSIKVDREERPDVDDVYMTTVQLMTGQGGWPLSAFLLPDRRPFFAGTYFPPEDRYSRPGFRTLLLRLSDAFRERRADVEETATSISEEVSRSLEMAARPAEPLGQADAALLTAALARLADPVNGGMGSSPKFPPHLAIAWWLSRAEEGDAECRALAEKTLTAMALGGIHDHLAGGFHRYSTDAHWLLPHFEKMLTDNAQLLPLYARAFALTNDPLHGRTAKGIGDYLLREMRTPERAFFAATDADSEGEEGKFFVWEAREIEDVLGKDDAAFFSPLYRVDSRGNFHDESSGKETGKNILHLGRALTSDEEHRAAPLRAKLLSRRSARVAPGLDDKRITGWNALAVSGLAISGRVLDEPRYIDAARAALKFLLETARTPEGRMARTWKNGESRGLAFLEDEAYLLNALLDLDEPEAGCRRVADGILARFTRKGRPGFTFSGEGHEALLATGRDLFDKAIPSGSGSAALGLARLWARTGETRYRDAARAAVDDVAFFMRRSPHGLESWYLALEALGEERAPARGAEAPVTIEACAAIAIGRGATATAPLGIAIAPGFHLREDGLRVEAWAGSDVEVTVTLPAPVLLEDGSGDKGHHGRVEATLGLRAQPQVLRGERTLTVFVRFSVCGEGTCRPEAGISVAVPLRVS